MRFIENVHSDRCLVFGLVCRTMHLLTGENPYGLENSPGTHTRKGVVSFLEVLCSQDTGRQAAKF